MIYAQWNSQRLFIASLEKKLPLLMCMLHGAIADWSIDELEGENPDKTKYQNEIFGM